MSDMHASGIENREQIFVFHSSEWVHFTLIINHFAELIDTAMIAPSGNFSEIGPSESPVPTSDSIPGSSEME